MNIKFPTTEALLTVSRERLSHLRALCHPLHDPARNVWVGALLQFFIDSLSSCASSKNITSQDQLEAQSLLTEYKNCLRKFNKAIAH